MQDKQKVTIYLPPELHRQLKIRAAVDSEPMSEIAQRALVFYLSHPDVVEEAESHGRSHRVYSCPECTAPVVLQSGEMVALGKQPGVLDESLLMEKVKSVDPPDQQGEQELVPC
ncbi:MAG: hypothetical protein KME16_24335 [Scytolyngbya sp. HA4215-MV1]|jgi:hypothetical protein|nr:hypothetical protein [Scytolyngbya sp. HA4215-MV1]